MTWGWDALCFDFEKAVQISVTVMRTLHVEVEIHIHLRGSASLESSQRVASCLCVRRTWLAAASMLLGAGEEASKGKEGKNEFDDDPLQSLP